MCVNPNLLSYPQAPGMQMNGRLAALKTVFDSNESTPHHQGDLRSKATQHATQWGKKGWHIVGAREMLAAPLRKGANLL